MPYPYRLISSILLAGATALGAAGIANAASSHHHAVLHHSGSCGAYMYWHAGKCEDARNRPGRDWSGAMSSKPAW